MIPTQPSGRDICARSDCQQPIHLTNTQLGPVWVHDDTGIAWCPITAIPAGRPWPTHQFPEGR